MFRSIIILPLIFVLFTVAFGQERDDVARDIFLGSRRQKTGPTNSQKSQVRNSQSKSSKKGAGPFGSGRPNQESVVTTEIDEASPASIATNASSSGTMGLGYTLFLKNKDTNTFIRVSPSRIFSTGDSVRLLVETNMDGYLYLFHQENNGPVRLLFPTSEIRDGDNRIWAHYPQFVPDPNLYEFTLTGGPAVENFTVITSRGPLPDVPIGSMLRGLKNVTIDRNVFSDITRPSAYREYHNGDDGSHMTDREGSRDVVMVKSDPTPAHIIVNRYSAGQRVVARFGIQHR